MRGTEGLRFAEGPRPGYLPGALLIRRAAFETLGGFDESLPAGEVPDFFSRASELRVRVLDDDRPPAARARRQHEHARPRPPRELPRGRAPGDRPAAGGDGVSVAEHDLLLRATLGPEDEARDAYERGARRPISRRSTAPPSACSRCSPSGSTGRTTPSPRRCAGSRASRGCGRRCCSSAPRGPCARSDAGVPVMLTKGAAVLAHTDWRVARRPMDDLDVAVPRALAPRAIEVLRPRGFESPLAATRATSTSGTRSASRRRGRAARPALARAPRLAAPRRRRGFWDAARPAELRGVACRVLCREDALLQADDPGARVLRHPPAAMGRRRRRAAPRRACVRLGARGRAGAAAPADGRAARGARGTRGGDREPVPGACVSRWAARRARARREESGGDGPLTPRAVERVGDELRTWVRREVAPGARVTPKQPRCGSRRRGRSRVRATSPRTPSAAAAATPTPRARPRCGAATRSGSGTGSPGRPTSARAGGPRQARHVEPRPRGRARAAAGGARRRRAGRHDRARPVPHADAAAPRGRRDRRRRGAARWGFSGTVLADERRTSTSRHDDGESRSRSASACATRSRRSPPGTTATPARSESRCGGCR